MQDGITSSDPVIPDPAQLELFGDLPCNKDTFDRGREGDPSESSLLHIRSPTPDVLIKEANGYHLNHIQLEMSRVLTAKSRALSRKKQDPPAKNENKLTTNLSNNEHSAS